MTAIQTATVLHPGATARRATPGRSFDEVVDGLEGLRRPDGHRASGRRATATRRGPIATPVQRGAERPVLRAGGVSGPRLAAAPARVAISQPRPIDRGGRASRGDRAATGRTAAVAAGWRLNDRGLAVVMAIGFVLVVASVVAVVTTAITVTSEDYRPATGVQQRV